MARTVRIPRNRDVDEYVSIVCIPKADMPDPSQPSAAVLNAAKDVTFEFTAASPIPTATQATKEDPRYAQREVQSALDKVTRSWAPEYFSDDEELELDPMVVEGAELFFFFRFGVHITEDFVPTTQKVDAVPVTVGIRPRSAPTGGKFTRKPTLALGNVLEDVVVAA